MCERERENVCLVERERERMCVSVCVCVREREREIRGEREMLLDLKTKKRSVGYVTIFHPEEKFNFLLEICENSNLQKYILQLSIVL